MKRPKNKVFFEFHNPEAGTCRHDLRGHDSYHLLADAFLCSEVDVAGRVTELDFVPSGPCNDDAEVRVGRDRVKFTVTKQYAYYDDNIQKSVLFANKECKCQNGCALENVEDKYFCNADGSWSSQNNLDLTNNCGNQ